METDGRCVLIIEDNALNMKLFSAMVAAQGVSVLQATDGVCGLDLAYQEHPDLIITDVNLPGMSGLEITQTLKRDDETRDIPIIITTAYGLTGDEPEIRDSGCDGFMAKPIRITEFLEMVEALIHREPRYIRRLVEANRLA